MIFAAMMPIITLKLLCFYLIMITQRGYGYCSHFFPFSRFMKHYKPRNEEGHRETPVFFHRQNQVFNHYSLSNRLQDVFDPILSFTKEMKEIGQPIVSIADIGADHGLLAMELASSKQYEVVYAIDINKNIINKLKSTYLNCSPVLYDKLQALVGDGVEPLLKRKLSANVLILSGLGVHSIFHILANTNPSFSTPNISHGMDCHDESSSYLSDFQDFLPKGSLKMVQNRCENLKTKMMVIQPNPGHLKNILKLLQLFLSANFELFSVSLRIESEFYFPTISVIRKNSPVLSQEQNRIPNLVNVFNELIRFILISRNIEQFSNWQQFLRKEIISFQKKPMSILSNAERLIYEEVISIERTISDKIEGS